MSLYKLFFFIILTRSFVLTSEIITIYLSNIATVAYSLPAYIGSKRQEVPLLIDTSIEASWVDGIDCVNCRNAEYKYDYKDSKDYKKIKETETVFQGRVVKGMLSLDSFGVGEKSFKDFNLIIAKDVEIFVIPYSGVLLLGPDVETAIESSNSNILYYLVISKLIEKPLFSLLLRGLFEQSKITFGGLDESITKEREKTQCNQSVLSKSKAKWACDIAKLQFTQGSKDKKIKAEIALERQIEVSITTNLIHIPKKDYFIIQSLMLKEENICQYNSDDRFYCYCQDLDYSRFPTITFIGSDNNKIIEIFPQDYILFNINTPVDNRNCILLFTLDYGDSTTWKVGLNAWRNYYSVFDAGNKLISFYNIRSSYFDPSLGYGFIITLVLIVLALLLFAILLSLYRKYCARQDNNENLIEGENNNNFRNNADHPYVVRP